MSANKAYIVGLTGGIASGKSEAAKYLESLGAYCVDADEISRALTAPGGELLPGIRAAFGDEVFNGDELNRRALAELVFGNQDKLRLLDSVTQPAIQKAMMDEVEAAARGGAQLVVLNVPLLFETAMDALCDETWLIAVDADKQLERLMKRDGMDREHAEARIASQMPQEEKLKRANVVIDNNKSIDKMYAEIGGLYSALVKKVARLGEQA